jgi:hypothetical protein
MNGARRGSMSGLGACCGRPQADQQKNDNRRNGVMKKILVISVTVLTLGAAILIISATVATLGAATLSSAQASTLAEHQSFNKRIALDE